MKTRPAESAPPRPKPRHRRLQGWSSSPGAVRCGPSGGTPTTGIRRWPKAACLRNHVPPPPPPPPDPLSPVSMSAALLSGPRSISRPVIDCHRTAARLANNPRLRSPVEGRPSVTPGARQGDVPPFATTVRSSRRLSLGGRSPAADRRYGPLLATAGPNGTLRCCPISSGPAYTTEHDEARTLRPRRGATDQSPGHRMGFTNRSLQTARRHSRVRPCPGGDPPYAAIAGPTPASAVQCRP